MSRVLGDWRARAEAAVLTLAVEVGVRWVSLDRLVRWAETQAPQRPVAPSSEWAQLVGLAGWMSRVPAWPSSCLRRAVIGVAFLRRRGAPAVVCIGVRKDGPSLLAHAWVECDGHSFGVEPGFERLEPATSSVAASVAGRRWSA